MPLWIFSNADMPQHVNIVRRLNIAFIRYPNRLNAEFTKVAMADQVSLSMWWNCTLMHCTDSRWTGASQHPMGL